MKNFQFLSEVELKAIKGGKRFQTNNVRSYMNKRMELARAGIRIKGQIIDLQHNHYCIEW